MVCLSFFYLYPELKSVNRKEPNIYRQNEANSEAMAKLELDLSAAHNVRSRDSIGVHDLGTGHVTGGKVMADSVGDVTVVDGLMGGGGEGVKDDAGWSERHWWTSIVHPYFKHEN